MQNQIDILVSSYQSQVREMCDFWREEFHKNGVVAFSGFVERWINIHVNILAAFSVKQAKNADTEPIFPSLNHDFLKARERMISALVQSYSKFDSANQWRQATAAFLRQHDEIFGHILQSAFQEMRRELIKARATEKALGGYAETSLFRGIR